MLLRRLALSLFTLLIALGALEAFLRVRFADRFYVWPPYWQRTMRPDPEVVHGVHGPSRFTVNGLGMRATPFGPDPQYRLLAVGGSTTICTYLDDEEAWPRLVQERVNEALGAGTLWVGNVGRPGHATSQHVLQVEKLLDQHPELHGVILLVGVNDLIVTLNLRRNPIKLPGPGEALKQAFAFPGWDPESPWYQRTGIGRLWRTRQWEAALPGRDRRIQDGSAFNVALWRSYRRHASVFLDALPDLTTALENYERNLRELVDIARAHGERILFLSQPTLWKPDLAPDLEALLWMGGPGVGQMKDGAEYYSAGALAKGMRQYNETLLRVCRERGVECLDVAARLPKDGSIFWDDAHFTEEGSRRLAQLVADYLLARTPLAGRSVARSPEPSGR